MTVEDLDRLVAALPEWERMPTPARSAFEWDAVDALLAKHREERRVWRLHHEAKMAQVRRTNRLISLLLACLVAGGVVAGLVNAVMVQGRAEFLAERP
jgi:hypothetical protein